MSIYLSAVCKYIISKNSIKWYSKNERANFSGLKYFGRYADEQFYL